MIIIKLETYPADCCNCTRDTICQTVYTYILCVYRGWRHIVQRAYCIYIYTSARIPFTGSERERCGTIGFNWHFMSSGPREARRFIPSRFLPRDICDEIYVSRCSHQYSARDDRKDALLSLSLVNVLYAKGQRKRDSSRGLWAPPGYLRYVYYK